jgi:hypothetical protein
MSNIKKFLKRWDEIEGLLQSQQEKIITRAASQVYKEIVDRTPVGRPELWSSPAPDGYKPGDLRKAWEIDWGMGYIHATATYSGKLGSVSGANFYVLGKDIWVRNQLDYAYAVEYGWSRKQAPQGMMRISIKQYQSFLDKATKNNKI